MSKKLKRIITASLIITAFSAIEPGNYLNLMTTTAYAADDDIYLRSLTIDGESIDLSKSKTSYSMDLTKSTDEVSIKVATEDEDDVVTIDGDNAEDFEEYSSNRYKATVSLDEGKNTFEIKVRDEDGENARTYTLKLDRGGKNSEDDIYLDKISLSEGNISFSPDETSYDVNVANSVSKLVIQAKPEDEDYTVEIDGDEVDEDDNYKKTIYLANGENEVSIVITDDDDNEREYTLNINRGGAASSTTKGKIDNKQDPIYLDDIAVDDEYIKNFNEQVTSYELNVKEDFDSIIVKAPPAEDDNVVRINGDRADSKYRKRVYLDKGKNVIEIKVSNEDDYEEDDDDYEERIYKLIVYRGTSQGSANDGTSNTGNTASKLNQWISINGRWQYNDALGNSLKNTWFYDKNSGKTYYLQDDGYMATGWVYNNGEWYYLDASGAMQTGWKQVGPAWYYLDNGGKMQTGWIKDMSGNYYYLYPSGAMAANTTINGYKIGANGAWIR